jgi:hypothetical protein
VKRRIPAKRVAVMAAAIARLPVPTMVSVGSSGENSCLEVETTLQG